MLHTIALSLSVHDRNPPPLDNRGVEEEEIYDQDIVIISVLSRKTFASTHGDHTVKIICYFTGRILQVRQDKSNVMNILTCVLAACCRGCFWYLIACFQM